MLVVQLLVLEHTLRSLFRGYEEGIEDGHVDLLRRAPVPRPAEAEAHRDGLAELGSAREHAAVRPAETELGDLEERGGLAAREQHPRDRVEHVLEHGGARGGDHKVLVQLKRLEEPVGVRLPDLI